MSLIHKDPYDYVTSKFIQKFYCYFDQQAATLLFFRHLDPSLFTQILSIPFGLYFSKKRSLSLGRKEDRTQSIPT